MGTKRVEAQQITDNKELDISLQKIVDVVEDEVLVSSAS